MIDSAVRTDDGPYHWLGGPIILGDIFGGPEQDVLISHAYEESGSAYIYADPVSKGDSIPTDKGGYDYVVADFNGDGRNEILSFTLSGNRWLTRINWWSNMTPPYDTLNSTLLLGSEDLGSQYACDINEDGLSDLIGRTETGDVRIYLGSATLPALDSASYSDTRSIIPIGFERSEFFACARLDPSLPPQFLVSSFAGGLVANQQINYRIATVGEASDISKPLSTATYAVLLDDSIWQPRFRFPDSWPGIADVNGDGIDDLCFNDSQHVYVWLGKVGFYNRMLTIENADLAIQGPVAFYPVGESKLLFPSIHSLGDVTGMGTPFFALNYYDYSGGTNHPVTFLYATGQSYDEYYDAYLVSPAFATSLTAINSGPTRALLWLRYETYKDRVEIADKGLETIPTTRLRVALIPSVQQIQLAQQADGVWTIQANGERCTIYDAIGRLHEVITLAHGVGTWNSVSSPLGTYFAYVPGYASATIFVRH